MGTPAMTTRGFGAAEFEKLAHLIDQVWRGHSSGVSQKVDDLARRFPVPDTFF
ncbi:hypothetical protein [Mycoplasma sp. ATU-Cv-508]|uniref:hypothetical protein n=1 Tax=Mycoplasma sp. ATU-Cv-508 TaxID=2048001 RepID=UPI001F38D5BF